jgi:cytoskeletal protein CcmA (bactofilin family)
MHDGRFDLVPEIGSAESRLLEARRQREIVARLVGEPRAARCGSQRDVPGAILERARSPGNEPEPNRGSTMPRVTPASPLADALIIPAGTTVRGYLRTRALVLAGEIVGNVHCTAGPVVIRAGATLKGRLVAVGDVYVCGHVGDIGGGAVIATRGKITLAPGAHVEGDVRSGRLDLYEGARLDGLARAYAD